MTVTVTVGSTQVRPEPVQEGPEPGQTRPELGQAGPESGQARLGPVQTPPESLAEALDRVYRALAGHIGTPVGDERSLDKAVLRSPTTAVDAWHPFAHLSRLFRKTFGYSASELQSTIKSASHFAICSALS